jgi:hypothetical protein
MIQMPEPLDTLDRRYRAACKVLFKQEVGPLSEFVPYLDGLIEPNMHRKSSISGKDVAYSLHEYSEGSKWISFDEIDFGKKYAPIDAGAITGLNSLLAAISGRVYYTGNVILGNSKFVESSSNVTDSFFMHNTSRLSDCKYCASTIVGRLCEDSFGVYGPGETNYCIRCTQTYRDKRCFECWTCQNCSDCYYSYNLDACQDCIFCFNLKAKRYCIGNLQLGPADYNLIKEKLLAEMAAGLKRDKKLPSLMDIIQKSPKSNPPHAGAIEAAGRIDKNSIDAEFSKTAKLLLGTELRGMDLHKDWLERHTHPVEDRASIASGERITMAPRLTAIPEIPHDRIVTMAQARALGELTKMEPADVEKISLANVHEKLGKLAFLPVAFYEGTNMNIIEGATSIDSSSCYRSSGTVYSKFCAYMFYTRNGERLFGCEQVFDSSFCINCYYSNKLTRCFECDSCRGCADCLFCHNCENVQDSMFCFNVKNMKYAIGNAEVGRENYLVIKKMVLSEIGGKLQKEHDLKLDIYNAGVFQGEKT